MAVRRRRPLVPLPHPRRNLYGPLSSKQSPHTPFPPLAKTAFAPLLLLLRITNASLVCDASWTWVTFLRKLHIVPFRRPNLRLVTTKRHSFRCSSSSSRKRFAGLRDELDVRYDSGKTEFAIGIVTHPAAGMYYNFITFQVFVSLTISLAGVSLASRR